jgi:hypothetical protein
MSGDLQDLLGRVWNDLVARPAGPLHFRFLLQPVMAAIMAIRHGIRDAREGRSPYFWGIVTDPEHRRSGLREGLTATAKIVVLGLVLDAAYQVMMLGAFYPGEALIVALTLGFLPYLILRGPAARLARHWIKPSPGGGAPAGPAHVTGKSAR